MRGKGITESPWILAGALVVMVMLVLLMGLMDLPTSQSQRATDRDALEKIGRNVQRKCSDMISIYRESDSDPSDVSPLEFSVELSTAEIGLQKKARTEYLFVAEFEDSSSTYQVSGCKLEMDVEGGEKIDAGKWQVSVSDQGQRNPPKLVVKVGER